jgi:glycosyltransferase involved in cell wall biosynthesis
MGNLKISVITPAYNAAEFIQETIESVLNAKTKINFEYIVVNDGSTDSTLQIISDYSEHIRILSFENQGESASVNEGLRAARGDYILVVNADDPILDESLFEEAVRILDLNPKVVAVYPDWQIINDKGEVIKQVIVDEFSLESLIGENRTLPGPGAIFRRESALVIGGRRLKWKYVGDYDFWLRLSALGCFQRIPRTLAQWREHSNSTSVSQKNVRMANERIHVIEEFLQDTKLAERIKKMALSNAYYLAARLAYFDKGINGRKLFFHALKKTRRLPSIGHPVIILYLIFWPISHYIARLLPRSLAEKTHRP